MKEKLITIIKNAGKILKEGYSKSNKGVSFKGEKDLVTYYDIQVEEYLKLQFSEAFKEFTIIAEESDNKEGLFNNSIIIDPIDGTTNFVNKVPFCAISVGVYKNKEPYMGIVYNPILDELYFAQTQKGAFLNGEPIHVSSDDNFTTSLISTGFPYSGATNKDDLNWVINKMEIILPKCQDIRRLGSAALDLCLVARGTYEGYYEMNLQAWDVSAGIIILSEAGGKVTNEKGNGYTLFEDKYIVASNAVIHQTFLEHLAD